MYEELVKRLREKAARFDYDGWVDTAAILKEAADAIEELSEELRTYKELMCNEHNRAAALAWEKEHQWIPVTERLPEENGYYLTYVESAIYPNRHYFNMIKFIDGDFIEDHCVIHRVTHWQPLPEPPKPKEETE